MSEEKQSRSTAEGDRASGASGAILLGTRIFLLRLLVGLVAGAVIAGIYATFNLFRSTDYSLTGHLGISVKLATDVARCQVGGLILPDNPRPSNSQFPERY